MVDATQLEEAAEFALSEAMKHCKWAEVRAEHISGDSVTLKNGIPEATGVWDTSGIAVRVLESSLGICFTNKLDKKSIGEAVRSALGAAKSAVRSERITFSEEKANRARYAVKQKKKIQDTPIEKKLEILFEVDKGLSDLKRFLPASYFGLSTNIRKKFYVNSDGARIEAWIPYCGADFITTAAVNGKTSQRMHQFGATGGWEVLEKWKLTKVAREEAEVLIQILKKAKPAPKGKLDLVLSPEIVGIASHESAGHPYEADRILGREAAQAGESFIKPIMLGTKIGSPAVTVVDDPTISNSNGFYLYDDEGIKARRRYMIKEGIINDFLHNRETARKLWVTSNAASRAMSWASEPIVRMANTFLLPGDYSEDELVEGIQKGVYIKTYTEWNIDDKRFNQKYVGLEAYEIVNGRLGGLVSKPVLEITTPTFWSSIDAVGKELAFMAGTCGKGDPMQGVPVWFGGAAARLRLSEQSRVACETFL